MLIRRPQIPSWKHPNPVIPDPFLIPLSPERWYNPVIPDPFLIPLSPERWLDRDSGGAVPFLIPLSPERWLDRDSGGAVGLAIVAALHKSNIANSQGNPIVSTAPVDIISLRSAACRAESCQHGRQKEWCRDKILFCRSTRSSNSEIMEPAADFLSHCSLCRKQLRGKDIYMYLEKAFCSIDCRYQQIVTDELQAKNRRSKMAKRSCSPSSGHGRLFFTGVIAT